MKRSLYFAAALALVAAAARADELDDLIRHLKVPARFAGHQPKFSVEKQSFTFEQMSGPETWDFWVVRDRERCVALVPFVGFHGGNIYLLTHDPALAPTRLAMPKERWHIDTAIGQAFRTDHFLPSKNWGEGDRSEWHVGADGATLALVRRFKGEARISKWEERRKGPDRQPLLQTIDTVNTFVLRVDPVLGYVVDATWDTADKPAPDRSEYFSLMPPGLSNPWPGHAPGARVASCPAGGSGYVGHYENHGAIELSGKEGMRWSCRDGGFAAYLNDETGWSPAASLGGGEAKFGVCNVHADLDFHVLWPKDLPADADGMKRLKVRARLCWLPPEITRHVWDRMEVWYADREVVIIGLGAVEDFEGEPSRLTTRKRGITFTHLAGPPIADGVARSGRKSMQVRGRVWPNLPQIVLKPGAEYRLEAWVKVAADGDGPAEAWIDANLYEWSPYSGEMVVKQKTDVARPGGEAWQKIALEFTAPKWGPFVNIVFNATGGTAYFDDFCFSEAPQRGP